MARIKNENGEIVEENLKHFENKEDSLIPQKATIVVPFSLFTLLSKMYEKTTVCKSNEYAVLYKVTRTPETLKFVISPDYFIPEQNVTPANVDVAGEYDIQKYNGVVHRHPNGVRSFSKTDEDTLNSIFTTSLVFIPGTGFTDSVVNVNLDSVAKIQVKANVEIYIDDMSLVGNLNDQLQLQPVEDVEWIVGEMVEGEEKTFAEVVDKNIKPMGLRREVYGTGVNKVGIKRGWDKKKSYPVKRYTPTQSELFEDYDDDDFSLYDYSLSDPFFVSENPSSSMTEPK